MKVLTSTAVFKGVARQVAVNMVWVSVFIVPAAMIAARQPPLSLAMLATLGALGALYLLVLWWTVAMAKWLIPKMQDEEKFAAATEDGKAAWIVSCAWWGWS